jgi:hypothetical protein
MGKRAPSDFDALGEGRIWALTGDYSRLSLYYNGGRLGFDVAINGGEFSEVLGMDSDAIEGLIENLDAFLRWRRSRNAPAKPRQVNHGFCPTHGLAWERSEPLNPHIAPAQSKLFCPNGDIWRTAPQTTAIIIPWEEEV